MTAKELKNALLQEAVQGKLVPQIASEGNAKDLLEEIQKEKAKLIKEGKIKKENPLPEITEEDIPFDIPDNWCWCRLGDITEIKSSKRVFEKDYVNDGIPFFRSKEIGDLSRGESIHTELFITKKHYEELKKNYGVPKINDILLTSVGSIGNNWICDGREFYYKDGNVTQICSNDCYVPKFLTSFLSSPLFFEQVNSSVSGTAYNALTIIKLKSLIFPLPPLAEQKRIVAAIEKFLPLIEEYGKKETELKAFNEQIGTLTKKAILQEAVQGKLVPQIAVEGNAKDLLEEIKKEKAKLIKEGKLKKEKPLPEITEDDIPFEIPDNWCWCRFGDIFQHNTGKTQNSSVETKNGTLRKFITTSNLYWNRFDFTKVKEMLFSENELTRCTVTKGDLLICEGGEYGRAAIWNYDYDVCFQNHVHRARAIKENTLHLEFYYYLLYLYKSIGLIEGRGVGIKSLSTENLHQIIIPLPPYNEQKRIITAITQVLSICEKIGN